MNRPGRFSVEDIVPVDAVHLEAVAGIPLPLARSLGCRGRIAARSVQHVGINAGTQNRELREAASAERCILNGSLLEHIADCGVHLIAQRRAGDFDCRVDRARLQCAENDGGLFASTRISSRSSLLNQSTMNVRVYVAMGRFRTS
jgi:hypothetical protein